MSENTKIEWTHHTFNPWLGCAKVHAGCTNCYAENHQAVAMRTGGKIQWGEPWQGGQRVVVSESTWQHPFTWARKAAKASERHRVFCASLSDVLEVPAMPPEGGLRIGDALKAHDRVMDARRLLDGARERLWATIRKTANVCGECGGQASHHVQRGYCAGKRHDGPRRLGGLDWLLLTKRPENWALVPEDVRPLVWLGASASDQETADEWVPRLLAAEGFRYRFLSVEPLVGPVDLDLWLHPEEGDGQAMQSGIDWVIVGGESGPKARRCNPYWIRNIVKQCGTAGVPVFVKQLGANTSGDGFCRDCADEAGQCPSSGLPCDGLKDPKGGDWIEWPEDLRVRQFPIGAP